MLQLTCSSVRLSLRVDKGDRSLTWVSRMFRICRPCRLERGAMSSTIVSWMSRDVSWRGSCDRFSRRCPAVWRGYASKHRHSVRGLVCCYACKSESCTVGLTSYGKEARSYNQLTSIEAEDGDTSLRGVCICVPLLSSFCQLPVDLHGAGPEIRPEMRRWHAGQKALRLSTGNRQAELLSQNSLVGHRGRKPGCRQKARPAACGQAGRQMHMGLLQLLWHCHQSTLTGYEHRTDATPAAVPLAIPTP